MTCIIGISIDNKVYMAGDSCTSKNGEYRITAKQKIFRHNNYLIGYTTSTRMGDLLRTGDLPHIQKNNVLDQMITIFVPRVREIFRSGGYITIDKNVEIGGNFLVGIYGRLFEIDTDFQVEEYLDGIAAVGSGGMVALASLMTSIRYRHQNYIPELLIRALKISGDINSNVRPPYYWDCI